LGYERLDGQRHRHCIFYVLAALRRRCPIKKGLVGKIGAIRFTAIIHLQSFLFGVFFNLWRLQKQLVNDDQRPSLHRLFAGRDWNLEIQKNKAERKNYRPAYSLIIPAMIILPQKDLVVLISLSGIVLFLAFQLWDIIKEGEFGALSVEFVVIYLATDAFWLAFSITIKNAPLIFFNAVVMIIYSVCLFLFFRYKNLSRAKELYERHADLVNRLNTCFRGRPDSFQ